MQSTTDGDLVNLSIVPSFWTGAGLRGDQIHYRVDNRVQAHPEFGTRKELLASEGFISEWFGAMIGINLSYSPEEIFGGHYLNRSLIAVVQEALDKCQCFIVDVDVYRKSGLVPRELPGCLVDGFDYFVVTKAFDVCGSLLLWQSRGLPERYFCDNLIMDFILDIALLDSFKTELSAKCNQSKVRFIETT
ncbi:MAG: hypothetical protein C0404_11250 [Verrucomicrobia bacterium]|nr:hypothetical protein [Verrucomicrobiota bacterium]